MCQNPSVRASSTGWVLTIRRAPDASGGASSDMYMVDGCGFLLGGLEGLVWEGEGWEGEGSEVERWRGGRWRGGSGRGGGVGVGGVEDGEGATEGALTVDRSGSGPVVP